MQQKPGSDQQDASQCVRAVLPDAPVGEDVVVPAGWRLTLDGVSKIGPDGNEPGLAWPVILTELSREGKKGTHAVTLAWFRENRWHQRVVLRDVIANARSAVELAAHGLPVHSNNARSFVQYLADFESQNRELLPLTSFSSQMGWQGEQLGVDGFLWGRTLLSANGQASGEDQSASAVASAGGPRIIHFRGADEGDDQIAEGFHKSGSLRRWLRAIEPISAFPKVRLLLYASFTSPVLSILTSPNFIVDTAGKTTTGKTSSLRVAASVWGCPIETSPKAAMSTWDATGVWRERAPAVLNGLPFILDDTKRARSPEDVAQTIYTVTQGRGRGRGSVRGIAHQDTWRTILSSSGEQPATTFTGDGGTRARVLSLWGSPFGDTDQGTGRLVRELNDAIRENYGHAGPKFIRYLLRHRDRWDRWREEYARIVELYVHHASGHPVAGRLAVHFAAITVTIALVHSAIDMPWNPSNVIYLLWDDLIAGAAEADRETEALRHVFNWASANQTSFLGRGTERHMPREGWAGRWDIQKPVVPGTREESDWSWIGIRPDILGELLRDGGFDPVSTIRHWKERDWLVVDRESDGTTRSQLSTRLGAEKVRLVAISRQAVDTVMGS